MSNKAHTRSNQVNPAPEPSAQGSAALSREQARVALLEFVGSNCCYGKGPAQEMFITDLQSGGAYHYNLDSYCERRSLDWTSEPHNGSMVINDGGGTPGMWDIKVQAPEMYAASVITVEMPNTANIQVCHSCAGVGTKSCDQCYGKGRRTCNRCEGVGHQFDYDGNREGCHDCSGQGSQRCYTCDGRGQTQCDTCRGKRNLRCYQRLTILWQVHNLERVIQRTGLPNDLIKDATGITAYNEAASKLSPINNFPDVDIQNASRELLEEHNREYPEDKILQQRHTVRTVPVTTISYTHKAKSGNFLIYAMENRVYFPDYPAKCCCSVL